MQQLAEGVWKLSGFPPNAINVFVVGDVLVDAATRFAPRRILRQLNGRDIKTHVLTHAHPTTRARATRSASASAFRCGAARMMPTPPSGPR
ncbi:MAG TPA: hypothetical protein VH817_17280 [Thermoleophilaceae bacterium]